MPAGRPKGRIFQTCLKIHFTDKMRDGMKRAAKEEETTEAEITRRAIRFYLNSKKYF